MQTTSKRRALDKPVDSLDEEYDLGKIPKKKVKKPVLQSQGNSSNMFQKKYEEQSAMTKHAKSDLKRSARHQVGLDKYFK